jgi:hypothetical protein
MNNSFVRLIDGMSATLRQEVLTRIDDEFARGQVFGVINLLNNFRLRADWSVGFLQEELAAQSLAFARVAELLNEAGLPKAAEQPGGSAAISLLVSNSSAEPVPDTGALLRQRDEGNQRIIELFRWLWSQPEGVSPRMRDDIELTLRRAMRSEVEVELRHLAKPMFAEMSQGSESTPAT